MKILKETRLFIGLLIVILIVILEIGKSIRINLLKKVDGSKIEAIGNYEKKSKIEYFKVLDTTSIK